MKYTLTIVLPTLGRIKEVEAMLTSIYDYEIEDSISAEIIVVDQNFSNIIDSVIEKFKDRRFPIIHHKVSFRGLSKAKNFGSSIACGQYICFVDDDAEFLLGTINQAIKLLNSGKYNVVSGRCVDRDGNNSVLHFENNASDLTINSFENRFVESTMFFEREICERFHYDESMGVGAFYGAEEGYDLVFRMLNEGVKIHFDPSIRFYHPHTVPTHEGTAAVRRAFTYRTGFGYLCKKHGFTRKLWSRVLKICVYIPYLLCVKPKDARFYFAELLGLLTGRFV